MDRFAVLGAAAVIGVALIGGLLLTRSRPDDSVAQTPAPTVVPSPSAGGTGLGQLDTSFVSYRHGYSVSYPGTWTVLPATADWRVGEETLWGDPAMDALFGTTARFVAASQPLGSRSAEQYYHDYCGTKPECADPTATWRRVEAGGATYYVDIDGAAGPPNAIVPDALVFDAVAVSGDRGYEFTLDGLVDRADFETILASVTLTPAAADVVSNLTSRFSSPLYDYTIQIAPTWTAKAATLLASDPASTDATALDTFTVTGTDTSITGMSDSLGAKTFEQWLADHHHDVAGAVPAGCDGGDPSTWPTVSVGSGRVVRQGLLDQLCNAADVVVNVGSKVYLFGWGNSSFAGSLHLQPAQFFRVLQGVDIPDAPAGAPSGSPSAAP